MAMHPGKALVRWLKLVLKGVGYLPFSSVLINHHIEASGKSTKGMLGPLECASLTVRHCNSTLHSSLSIGNFFYLAEMHRGLPSDQSLSEAGQWTEKTPQPFNKGISPNRTWTQQCRRRCCPIIHSSINFFTIKRACECKLFGFIYNRICTWSNLVCNYAPHPNKKTQCSREGEM